MILHIWLLVIAGTYFIQMNCNLRKAAGYSMLGYATNLFILTVNKAHSPLPQSLILTSIVIGMAFTIIMIRQK